MQDGPNLAIRQREREREREKGGVGCGLFTPGGAFEATERASGELEGIEGEEGSAHAAEQKVAGVAERHLLLSSVAAARRRW